jgi:hypothetical protein
LVRGGKVLIEYHLTWPQDVQGKFAGGLSPLSIHFVRMEVEDQPTRVLAHFEKWNRGAKTLSERNSTILDFFVRDAQTGMARSTDVMITKLEDLPKEPGSNASRAKMTVDVLYVEVPDPS